MFACKDTQFYNIVSMYRGGYNSECVLGYKGKLCSQCLGEYDGDYYARVGVYDCTKC